MGRPVMPAVPVATVMIEAQMVLEKYQGLIAVIACSFHISGSD
jgi:hypothetical protein